MKVRSTAVSCGLALVLGIVSGCSGDDGDNDSPDPKGGGNEQPEVTIVARPGVVTGKLPQARAANVSEKVCQVVDTWLDAAYLDPATAFAGRKHPGFTKDLTVQARKDAATTSSRSLKGTVDSMTATRKAVRVDIFSPDRKPSGATARYRLVFTTAGEADSRYVARGVLNLSPGKNHGWRVFAYDDVTLTEKGQQ